jgi:hypothetical protein
MGIVAVMRVCVLVQRHVTVLRARRQQHTGLAGPAPAREQAAGRV